MSNHDLESLQQLVETFAARGDGVAIRAFLQSPSDGGAAEVISYSELHATIQSVARGLRDKGFGAGDSILLCAPNSPGWIAAYFGIVCAGATAVPIDDQASKDMLTGVQRHSRARFAFTSARHAEELRDTPAALEGIALLDRDETDPRSFRHIRAQDGKPLAAIDAAQVASLLYTSGTTGTPKAVPLTHRNLASNTAALMAADLIRRTDRVLMPLPMHHTYPFTVGMLTVLGTGATLVMPSGVTGPEITGAAKASASTELLGVPSLYEAVWQGIDAKVKAGGERRTRLFRRLLALSGGLRRLTGIRVGKLLFRQVHAAIGGHLEILGCGGAKLDPRLAQDLESLGWTVLTGYGLTETSPVLTFNSRRQRRLKSEGRALPGVELRIDKKPDEAHGEILARGPNIFSGYWENPEATRAAFTEDGWFRTGDLGWIDRDGFLHVIGRLKEVIVLADGKNVLPEDVEPAYAKSPLLREIGILERNGALVALVVPDDDEVRRRGGLGALRLLKEELERAALELPPYQRIVDFRAVREPLPRTRLGKIKRHQLPQLYERAGKRSLEDTPVVLSDADQALIASSDTTKAVWSWLEQRYPDRQLHLDMSPQLDLQIDSLGWVSMTLELEHRFGVALPGASVSRILTLRDLLTEVEKARTAAPGTAAARSTAVAAPKPPGPFLRVFGGALYTLNRLFVRTLYRVRVKGADALPGGRCLVVTPNHLSYLDPLALAAVLPRRVLKSTHWAGWVGKMYAGPVSSLVSRATRVFPVDPNQDLTGAIGTAGTLIERGASVVWFPEGRRSPTGALQPFRPGIGVLLKGRSCLVVPTYVSGTYEAWPMKQRWPKPGVSLDIAFGDPVSVDELVAAGEGETDEIRIANALERRVAALASGLAEDDEPRSSRTTMTQVRNVKQESTSVRADPDGHR